MKIWLWHFLVYMAKYPHGKKMRTSTEQILRKMSQTDRQADRETDRMTDRQTERWTNEPD